MDVTILRILTEKSIIWFGKWEGYSVGQMIGLKHTAALRWIYYNCSKVSFVDEVLDKIYIRYDEYKIEKPGKNPELCQKLKNLLWAKTTDENRIWQYRINKRGKTGLAKKTVAQLPTKGQMQSKNHGH